MADQITKIEDVVVPELFSQYVLEKTTEKNELLKAGVVQANPLLNTLVNGGGTTITMPKWEDLTGRSQLFTEGVKPESHKLTSHKEIATLLLRQNKWGAHDLAAALAGDDPMGRIVELVSDWWARDEKQTILSIIRGVFACSDMEDHILNITGKQKSDISAKAVLETKQLMGDAANKLTMIYMHSAVLTALQEQQLITFVEPANAKVQIPTYLGYRVISDDSAPVQYVENGKTIFTTYLFSEGCIQRGVGTPVGFVPTETDRDKDLATDFLYNRQAKVLHPKGFCWIGTANIKAETPTDAELEVGTNWQRVAAEHKMVGMVALKHTIPEED